MPFEISYRILNPYTAKCAFYEVLQFFTIKNVLELCLSATGLRSTKLRSPRDLVCKHGDGQVRILSVYGSGPWRVIKRHSYNTHNKICTRSSFVLFLFFEQFSIDSCDLFYIIEVHSVSFDSNMVVWCGCLVTQFCYHLVAKPGFVSFRINSFWYNHINNRCQTILL